MGWSMKVDELLRALAEIERAAAMLVSCAFSAAEANALAEAIAEKSKVLRQPFGIGRELDTLRGEIAVAGEGIRSLIAEDIEDGREVISSSSRTLLDLIDHFFRLSDNSSRAA